jgi:hypothetical protein
VIIMDDSNFNLNSSLQRKCRCVNCQNKADTFIRIVSIPVDGAYCAHCALDLGWHGISEEDSRSNQNFNAKGRGGESKLGVE